MWGYQPWDNDRAADWFAKIIADSKFADQVRTTLTQALALDYLDDEVYRIRAACYCLLKFGYVYVWPVNELKADLQLAIRAIDKVLQEEEEEYETLRDLFIVERQELQDRLSSLE
jgi:hypothetical protein